MVKNCFKSKLLDESSLREIGERIAKIEIETSGEIVCLVIPRSDSYRYNLLLWSLIGWFTSSLYFLIRTHFAWETETLWLLEYQLVGMFSGALFAFYSKFSHWTISPMDMRAKVHRECLANFTAYGLHHTREHTGILLLLSEYERRIEILADRGIHTKLGQAYWDEEVSKIIGRIKEGHAKNGILESLDRIGLKLKEHFPPNPDDHNELSNEVRLGSRSKE